MAQVDALGVKLTPYHSGVVVAAVLAMFLNTYFSLCVGAARRKYKVPYPNMYASETDNKDAKIFNCIQRAHQNYVEFIAIFFASLLVGGIQYPVAATVLGVLYCISRLMYFQGYSTGNPEKRFVGAWFFFCLFGLQILMIAFAVKLGRGLFA